MLSLCHRRWPGIGRHMWHSSGRLAYVGLFWVCATDGGQALVGTCGTRLDVWPMSVHVEPVPQTVARHWSGTCGTRLDVWPLSIYVGSVPQTVARHWCGTCGE